MGDPGLNDRNTNLAALFFNFLGQLIRDHVGIHAEANLSLLVCFVVVSADNAAHCRLGGVSDESAMGLHVIARCGWVSNLGDNDHFNDNGGSRGIVANNL